MNKKKLTYEEWQEHRDNKEHGFYCLVKLFCGRCGYRWIDYVRMTLPPCPRCSSYDTYEYETISV